MRVLLDQTRCSSLGLCEAVAPVYFEIGDDGSLALLQPEPPESERALIEQAVASCPTAALSLVD